MSNQKAGKNGQYGGNLSQEVRKGSVILASPIPQHASKKNPFQKLVDEQRNGSKVLMRSGDNKKDNFMDIEEPLQQQK